MGAQQTDRLEPSTARGTIEPAWAPRGADMTAGSNPADCAAIELSKRRLQV